MSNINALEINDGDVGVASCHLTGNPKTIGRIFGQEMRGDGWEPISDRSPNSSADFVSVKTTNGRATRGIKDDPCEESVDRRIAVLRDGRNTSAVNSETSFGYTFAEYLEMLEKSLKIGKPLMISVGYEPDEIISTIRGIREVSNNYSNCPIAFELSLHHAQDMSVVKDRIKAAVGAVGDYPLFVKISYYGGEYLEIARVAVEECGAKGIIGINSLGPFDDVNGVLSPGDAGWLSGYEISGVSQEICRQVVADVCDKNGVPYVAVGGVNHRNIADYFTAGANAVAVCTYLMDIGVEKGLITLKKALAVALRRRGVASIQEIRSTARNDIIVSDFTAEMRRLSERVPLLAGGAQSVDGFQSPLGLVVDPEECNGCGICADACSEGAIVVDQVAKIRSDVCEVCGACIGTCRQGAISFETLS